MLFLDILNTYKEFVPDMEFTVVSQVEAEGAITTRWMATGRHYGCAGNLPPSGRSVSISGAFVVVQSGGRLKATIDFGINDFLREIGIDRQTFNAQLGTKATSLRIRAEKRVAGVAVLFVPPLNIPGWLNWRSCADLMKYERPVVNVQLTSSRRSYARITNCEGYTISSETRALTEAVASVRCDGPFHVVGDSAGATVALDFTLTNRDRVLSLTLIEPSLLWLLRKLGKLDCDITSFYEKQLRTFAGRVTERKIIADLLQVGVFPNKQMARMAARWKLILAYRHSLKYRPALYVHDDDPVRLEAIVCPVLLVEGTTSARFYHEVIESLQSKLVNARHVRLPGGHGPHKQDMVAFTSMLREFLARSEEERARL